MKHAPVDMLKKMMTAVLIFSAAAVTFAGDVYSLWPFPDSSAVTVDAAAALQAPEKFWNEKIIVNGAELRLDISLLNTPMKDLFKQFQKMFKDRNDVFLAGNSNSMLVQELQKDGSLKRQYYLELSGIQPVLLFEMTLPKDRKPASAENWPADLPLVGGAKDLTCMEFPVRQATFGAYRLDHALMPQVLTDLTGRIEGMGWKKVSRESDRVFEGTGEVFLNSDSSAILILGIAKTTDEDGVRVSMYTRPIR